jgi:hypothetical protein
VIERTVRRSLLATASTAVDPIQIRWRKAMSAKLGVESDTALSRGYENLATENDGAALFGDAVHPTHAVGPGGAESEHAREKRHAARGATDHRPNPPGCRCPHLNTADARCGPYLYPEGAPWRSASQVIPSPSTATHSSVVQPARHGSIFGRFTWVASRFRAKRQKNGAPIMIS